MKFCSNCGTQLSDDTVFCSNCGSKQAVMNPQQTNVQQPYMQQPNAQQPYMQQPYVQQPNMQQPYSNAAAAPKKSMLPWLIVAGIALVIVLVLFIPKAFGFGNGRSSGYTAALDGLCAGINNRDINKIYKILPPSMEPQLKTMASLAGMDEADIMDELFSEFGSENVKVKYKVNDAVRMTQDEIADYQDEYSYILSKDEKIVDGYFVDVTLTAVVDGESDEDTDEIAIVKIGNRWCLIDF